MGLIKNNYFSKTTGLTLPTAYAIIKDIVLNGNNRRAIFVIQSSRNATQNYKPIDKVEIPFVWDRKTDIAKVAYDTAKTQIIKETVFDKEKGQEIEVESCGVLFGWIDDKV
jgi:hypothetical protein